MIRRAKGDVEFTYNGEKFDSKFEVDIAYTLDTMGIKWKREPVRIPWYPKLRWYKPDFSIEVDGETVYIEAKGYFDPMARSKMEQIKMQHPDKDIRFIFMRDEQKISSQPGSGTYKEWAEKHEYPLLDIKVLKYNECNTNNNTEPARKRVRKPRKTRTEQSDSSASQATSVSGAQPSSTTRRSRRTEAGSVSKEKKQHTTTRRSSTSSCDSNTLDC